MLFATFRFCSHVSCKVISDDKCCLCCFPRRLETQKPPCESQSRNIMNPPGKSTTCSWPESPDVGASSFFCTMPVFSGDLFFFSRIYVCFPIFAHVICSMYWYLLIDVWRKILCSATKTSQAPGLDWRTSPECRGRWQWLESWSSLDHHTTWYCDTMVVQLPLVSLVACCVFRILVPRQWIIGSRTVGRSVIRSVWYCGV